MATQYGVRSAMERTLAQHRCARVAAVYARVSVVSLLVVVMQTGVTSVETARLGFALIVARLVSGGSHANLAPVLAGRVRKSIHSSRAPNEIGKFSK